jgi:large subunit ribosomal protein L13e
LQKGEKAVDTKDTETVALSRLALPIIPIPTVVTEIKKSAMPKTIEGGAYTKLRVARSDARLVGVREKRAKEKADAEAAKK